MAGLWSRLIEITIHPWFDMLMVKMLASDVHQKPASPIARYTADM